VLPMKLLVPSLEIRRLSGFGLLDEKGALGLQYVNRRKWGRHRAEGF